MSNFTQPDISVGIYMQVYFHARTVYLCHISYNFLVTDFLLDIYSKKSNASIFKKQFRSTHTDIEIYSEFFYMKSQIAELCVPFSFQEISIYLKLYPYIRKNAI